MQFAGENTNLELSGAIPLGDEPMNVTARGEANLAIMQLVFGDLRSAGAATLEARLEGDRTNPTFSGYADIRDGQLRVEELPRSLTDLNGRITFDASGVNVDQLHGKMGEGDVQFGGFVGVKGYLPDEFNVTASGRGMLLRYPAGFQTTVNTDLALTGPVAAPTLSGRVTVLRSSFTRQIGSDVALLGGLAGGGTETAGAVEPEPGGGVPLALALDITAPRSSIRIENRTAHIYGSADLQVRGTISRPTVTGSIEIDRGDVVWNGNRYTIPRGRIDFLNQARIDPFFDIEAQTRPRAPGQTYVVNLRVTGTLSSLNYTLTSEPVLPQPEILLLLFGATPDVETAERQALLSPQQSQQQMMQTLMTQLVTSPISSTVGSVFERTGLVDTVQISPFFGSQSSLQQLNPTARLTLTRRISDKVFLTYSRELNANQYEIILLEYEMSDRVSWILSRNEDRSFALDFRIRHVF